MWNSNADVADAQREIGRLVEDIEGRLSRLNTIVKRKANTTGQQVGDYVSDSVGDIAGRLQEIARSVGSRFRANATKTGEVVDANARAIGHDAALLGNQALTLGNTAMRRLGSEIEHRPFAALALGLAVGVLIGFSASRSPGTAAADPAPKRAPRRRAPRRRRA